MTTKTDTTGHMKGGIRRRGEHGLWAYTIDLGPQPAQRCNACSRRVWVARKTLKACPACGGELRDTMERRQETAGGFATQTAAKKARTKSLHDLNRGTHVVRDNITLGAWLTDEWLPSLEGGKLRETTRASYVSHVKHHLAPTKLGALPLQQLTRERISAHYALLLKDGRADGSRDDAGALKPLTASTVRRIHATLHRALRDAVRSHLLQTNHAGDLDLPSGENDEGDAVTHAQQRVRAWDSAQLSRFLAAVSDDRLRALWLTYALTGARRGELLGLTWDDIDLEAAQLTIRRAHVEVGGEIRESKPKTASGVRTIELDPATVAALKRHRTAQKVERMAAGPGWQESGHVFVDESGQPLPPGLVSRAFTAAVKTARGTIDAKDRDAVLPMLSLHGLRHTMATIMLIEDHEPVSVVSKRLGHKTEAITLTMYCESLPRYDGNAAKNLSDRVVPQGF